MTQPDTNDARRSLEVLDDVEAIAIMEGRHPASDEPEVDDAALAIARALMNGPKLLLLDEPSLGLSPLLVREIFRIIAQIRDEGVTMLLVEQNARMALGVADYGLILENGRFVKAGTPAELMADEDVQEFYLGVKKETSVKGYQRYKRKKRWR